MLLSSAMTTTLSNSPPSLPPQLHQSPPPPPPITSYSSSDHRAHLLSLLDHRTPLSHLKQIHAQALRISPSDYDPQFLFLLSRILYFSSFHDLRYCSRIFSQSKSPNSFSWNTLIRACANSPNQKSDAFELYNEMIAEGRVSPDKHTFPFVLKACAYLFELRFGEQAHAQLLKLGFDWDVYINNSLIHFYSSCGLMELARKVFDKMPERSCVSWNAMIDALVRSGQFEIALRMFVEMQKLFEPDGYTLQSVVSACAGLGALSLGMWAHAYLVRRCDSKLKNGVLVNNSVVEMYCKCGMLKMAKQVFDRMPSRDVNSWNSMILGLAMHGEAEMALDCFDRMVEKEGLVPNSVTFVGLLSACNHRGMVSRGRAYFDVMVQDYKIEPQLEHYGCLVDLLARAGLIEEALDVISEMPMKPDLVIWRSLLDGCCNKNGGLELSEEVARQVLESEGAETSGVYVIISKLYASAARWDEVGLVRKLMTDRGVRKEPGCSSIEVEGVNHEFFAGDTCHPEKKLVYKALEAIEERLKEEGYGSDGSEAALVDEEEWLKRRAVWVHSERLAIAYGLIHRRPGMPIRVFKNLRVCKDCHEVSKAISKVYDVEIIVRDRARFHHFKGGSCTCLDYW